MRPLFIFCGMLSGLGAMLLGLLGFADENRIDPRGVVGTLLLQPSPSGTSHGMSIAESIDRRLVRRILRSDDDCAIVVWDEAGGLDKESLMNAWINEGTGVLVFLKHTKSGLTTRQQDDLARAERILVAISVGSNSERLRDVCRSHLGAGKTLALVGDCALLAGDYWIDEGSSNDHDSRQSLTRAPRIGWGLLPTTSTFRHRVDMLAVSDELFQHSRQTESVFCLDEDAAISIEGRIVRSLQSQSKARFILPPSKDWPQRIFEISRRPRDLVALRRSSRWRREAVASMVIGDSAPALSRADRIGTQPLPGNGQVSVEHGSLLIAGGGRLSESIINRFIELAGGDRASIVMLPTAQADPISDPGELRDRFENAGAKRVAILKDRRLEDVESAEFLQQLNEATAIWFCGGRQWRFVDAYENSIAVTAMRALLKRGGTIGGSSAGASIQGDYLARGNPLGNIEIMSEGYERGFAFLPGSAIDQHFTTRKRLPDLKQLVTKYPGFLGVGVDESTAVVVQNSLAQIIGKGQVHFVWRSQDEPESTEFVVVQSGQTFDLSHRKIMTSE